MSKEYFGIAFCDQCGEEIDRVGLWDLNGTHLAYPEDWYPEDICDNEECQAAFEAKTDSLSSIALQSPTGVLTKEIAEHFLLDEDYDISEYTKIENDDVAEILGKAEGDLDLEGLTELSDAAAESLSKRESAEGDLDLSGLTELSDAAAESLSKHEGRLYLNGLTELSDAAAESLSKYKGCLYLNGLTELSDATAECLSKHKGDLHLAGLTELSDSAAEILGKREGYLLLNGLTRISDASAETLSKHRGPLFLSSLTELSDAAAESLSKHEGYLALWLDDLPASAAQILRDAGHE